MTIIGTTISKWENSFLSKLFLYLRLLLVTGTVAVVHGIKPIITSFCFVLFCCFGYFILAKFHVFFHLMVLNRSVYFKSMNINPVQLNIFIFIFTAWMRQVST